MSPTHKDSSVARLLAALADPGLHLHNDIDTLNNPDNFVSLLTVAAKTKHAHTGADADADDGYTDNADDVRMSLIPGAPAPR